MDEPKILDLPLKKIVADQRVQSRVGLNEKWVETLRERLRDDVELNGRDGKDWPVCYHDGKTYWLAKGFHRREAHAREKRATMLVEVRPGTMRDAILLSVSSNVYHGAPLTNEDKERAVRMLLADPEWRAWSNRKIGRLCGVSHGYVGCVKERIADEAGASTGFGIQLTKSQDGKERDVSGIALSNIVRRLSPEVREKFEGLSHDERVMLLDGIKEEIREEIEEKKEREWQAVREKDWRAARNEFLADALDAAERITDSTARDIQVEKDLRAVLKLTKPKKRAI